MVSLYMMGKAFVNISTNPHSIILYKFAINEVLVVLPYQAGGGCVVVVALVSLLLFLDTEL